MQKHQYSTTVITKETSPASVVSLSLEEQLSLQEAMQPACRSLVSLVRLGYYFRYHTGSFLALWNEYWGASAGFELEVLRVHLLIYDLVYVAIIVPAGLPRHPK